jgi:hypothetical protein
MPSWWRTRRAIVPHAASLFEIDARYGDVADLGTAIS